MGWNVKKIPLIGSDLAKVGKIYDMATMPCTPTAEIWVLAFWYGIPNMLWAIYKPDPLDDVYERVGRRVGIKRRQKFKFVEGFTPDIELPPGTRWVKWTIDLAQKIGWWLLIVDAAVDHAMYWQSAAMSLEGCHTPGTPYAQGTFTLPSPVNTGTNWQRSNCPVTLYHIFTGGIGDVVIPSGFGFHAAYEIKSVPDPSYPPNLQATVKAWRIVTTGGTVLGGGKCSQTADGKASVGTGFIRAPVVGLFTRDIVFEFTCGEPGFAVVTSESITVTGAGIPLGIGPGDP